MLTSKSQRLHRLCALKKLLRHQILVVKKELVQFFNRMSIVNTRWHLYMYYMMSMRNWKALERFQTISFKVSDLIVILIQNQPLQILAYNIQLYTIRTNSCLKSILETLAVNTLKFHNYLYGVQKVDAKRIQSSFSIDIKIQQIGRQIKNGNYAQMLTWAIISHLPLFLMCRVVANGEAQNQKRCVWKRSCS